MPGTQAASSRTTNSSQRRMKGNAMVNAGGGSWKNPKVPLDAPAPGVVKTPYFDYNYVDINIDAGAPGFLPGHQHVYAVGYELAWDEGFMLGGTYEFGRRLLLGDNNFDSHTGAIYGAMPIHDIFYGFLIGGLSDGAQAGPNLPNASGQEWFFNPGIGTAIPLGNLTLSATASYLYSDFHSSAIPDTETGTFVAELEALYDITDSLFVRSTVGYSAITENDFAAGTFDPSWWTTTTDIGIRLANGVEAYAGYSHDFAHAIFDLHTIRFGALFEY